MTMSTTTRFRRPKSRAGYAVIYDSGLPNGIASVALATRRIIYRNPATPVNAKLKSSIVAVVGLGTIAVETYAPIGAAADQLVSLPPRPGA